MTALSRTELERSIAMLNQDDDERLDRFYRQVRDYSAGYLGYPVSRDFDYSELIRFLDLPLNNLGDPFQTSTWKVDTKVFEQEVLEFMARLFRAPEQDWWGYVTNGGSEGNLYGLYLARELYPEGMVYYSQDTHYSVGKNLHLLNMRHIMIRSMDNGEIDYEDLRETIRIHRDKPAIIFANIGTTMTEAKDDLGKIRSILKDLVINEHYIHSDAALCGGTAPFVTPRPRFDFEDGADSLSVSGHKSFGSPIPCGVVLAKKSNVSKIARSIAYIGSLDTTITGSRNGLTPLLLWYRIKKLGLAGLQARVVTALGMAARLEERLRGMGIPAWRNPGSVTVVFPEAPLEIRERWQLATADGRSHVILMPGTAMETVDAFLNAMKQAVREPNSRKSTP